MLIALYMLSVYIDTLIQVCSITVSGCLMWSCHKFIEPAPTLLAIQAVAKCCSECTSAFLEVEFAGLKCADTFNVSPIL